MGTDGPKSSYELAMERLRKQDAEAGVEHKALTAEQKAAIAEVRSFYGAKLAQEDVLQKSRLRTAFDPAVRLAIEDEYQHERERLTSEMESKIEKARRG